MQAIRTKYSGPTDTRGSRIIASTGDGKRVSCSLDYSGRDDHEYAAYKLMEKMDWPNELVGGGFKNEQYWVMLPHSRHDGPFYAVYFEKLKLQAR